MKDAHREKLDNRLTPIHLFKLTPGTNCGECGFATCLAFAAQVIVGQGNLDSCGYLDPNRIGKFRTQLVEQHRSGIGVRREGFEKAMSFLREEMRKCDLKGLAESLGASFLSEAGRPALRLVYFAEPVIVTREDVFGAPEWETSPWEKIFIFNYVIGGAVEPSGIWVGMETLPNSVSKIKSLRDHCELRLAQSFAGKTSDLNTAISGIGTKIEADDQNADFAAEFQILPRLAVRILWWDEEPNEGFEPHSKFLFDSRVLQVLDLESLLFACEQLTKRLLAQAGQVSHRGSPTECHCHN